MAYCRREQRNRSLQTSTGFRPGNRDDWSPNVCWLEPLVELGQTPLPIDSFSDESRSTCLVSLRGVRAR